MRFDVWLYMIWVVFVSGGATCMHREIATPYPSPPIVFQDVPSVSRLVEVVNRTDSIRELASNSASVEVLSMPSLPKLSATIALQRDRNFRLRANLPIVLGSGLDIGSNQDVFWFEVPEGMSKTLYYAQHERYRQQLNRAILPVDPTWLIDALGLVRLDASQIVAGPVKRDDGLLEVRSLIPMPDGAYQRVCFIEPTAGYVTHQFLYAPDGREIAKSVASNHRYYSEQSSALPHRVEFQLMPSGGPPLAMRVDIGTLAINQLLSSDPQQFVIPQNASEAYDLTNLAGAPPPQPTSAYVRAAGVYPVNRYR
jgi:hypothetical protein